MKMSKEMNVMVETIRSMLRRDTVAEMGAVSDAFSYRWSQTNESVVFEVVSDGVVFDVMLSYFPEDREINYRFYESSTKHIKAPQHSLSHSDALDNSWGVYEGVLDRHFQKHFIDDVNRTIDELEIRMGDEDMYEEIELDQELRLEYEDKTVIFEAGDKLLITKKTEETDLDAKDEDALRDYLELLEDQGVEIIVNSTYERWNEEAIEAGEASDRGFQFEDEKYGPYELFQYMKREGYMDPSYSYLPSLSSREIDKYETIWISTISSPDYRTGDDVINSMHFSTKNRERFALIGWAIILNLLEN